MIKLLFLITFFCLSVGASKPKSSKSFDKQESLTGQKSALKSQEEKGDLSNKVDLANKKEKSDLASKVDLASKQEKGDLASKKEKSDLSSKKAKSDLASKKAKSDLASKQKKGDLASKQEKGDLANKVDLANKKEKSDLAGKKAKSDLSSKKEKVDLASKKEKVDLASKKEKSDLASKKEKSDLSSKKANVDLSSKKANVDLANKKAKSDLASKKAKSDLASKKEKSDLANKKAKSDLSSKKAKSDLSNKKAKSDLASKKAKVDLASKQEKVDLANKSDLASKKEKSDLASKQEKSDLASKDLANKSDLASKKAKSDLANQGEEDYLISQEEKSDIEELERNLSSQNIKKLKFKRNNRFEIPEEDSLISKKPKKRLNLEKVQPSSSIRIYYQEGSDEAQLEKVMMEEEKHLFKLLKKNRNAELTLRLGALYVDRSRVIAYKIQSDYEFKMSEYNNGLRKSKPFLNLKPAQVYNRKSLKLFEDFIQSYPNHKRMDEVLFFLGFNFYQLENKKKGIEYYAQLEKQYPKSFYIYEARFQLGEHYFQLSKWKESYKYYRMVSKDKTGKFYFYSLYKMAWSLYKMNQVSQGLSLLKRIIEEGRAFSTVSDRSQTLNFKDDAKEDLVLFYTYSRQDSSMAKSFFIDLLGEDEAWPLLEKLAYTYRDTGQTRSQVILFQNLISSNPSGKKAFEYKYQIVEAIYATGKALDIIKIIKEWVRDYGPGSSWVTANQRNQQLIKKSLELQEVTIRDYVLKNHQSYRKSRSNRPKQLALNLYEYYFSAFPKSKYSDQMYFWYAELLFDSKKYISAIKAYEEVISLFPNSKYVAAAYLNQVLAFEKSFPKEAKIRQIIGNEKNPVDMPQIIKSFIQVAKRYVTKFPKAENSPSILYTVSGMYYKFNYFDEATVFFKQISMQYPKHSLSSGVNAILLDIYNKNKDYAALEELAHHLSKNPNLDRKLLKEVKSILEQISLKKAESLSAEKKYKESALLYESFAKTHPNSVDAVSAFFNAGLNFEKVKDYLKAISMYSSVLTYKNVNSNIRKKSHRFLAILNEKLGFYKKSADFYVSFAKKYPKDSQSSDFWYNAGVIFDALNQVPNAIFSYNKYYETSKKSDRHDVFFLIGVMYEDNRKWSQAIKNYSRFLKTPSSNAFRVTKASFSVGEIYEKKLRNPALAKQWYEKTLNLYRRLETGSSYGARAHFYLVKKDYYEPFSKIKLPKNPKAQEKALARKIKLLQNMEKALKPVIRYNEGEVILDSLALIGRSNEELARSIESAPIPKGLNKATQNEYKKGIRSVINPYIKKSIEHYQLVIKRSVKHRAYSEIIGDVYSRLAGIQFSKGKFVRFLPQSLFQETFSVSFEDDTGTVNSNFLNSLTKSVKYNLSREDFENLSKAIQSKSEKRVLSAVSVILNKDLSNIVAINSLAFFYFKTNRLGLAQLILNRLLTDNKKGNAVILNNLALISLKYRNPRQAVFLLKKAIKSNSSYRLAYLNLADIFINQKDYQNAYFYYKKAIKLIEKGRSKKGWDLKSNYSVALTGSQKWSESHEFFQSLTSISSPRSESLFNYSCFLAEKSKRERREVALSSLNQAKSLVEELKVYRLGTHLKNKVRKLSRNVSFQLKLRSKK